MGGIDIDMDIDIDIDKGIQMEQCKPAKVIKLTSNGFSNPFPSIVEITSDTA
jgi:hypothetical protein